MRRSSSQREPTQRVVSSYRDGLCDRDIHLLLVTTEVFDPAAAGSSTAPAFESATRERARKGRMVPSAQRHALADYSVQFEHTFVAGNCWKQVSQKP